MIVDCHVHIFQKRVLADRARFFDSEPEFKLLYNSDKAAMAGFEDVISVMDEQAVDVSVVCGFPWHDPDLVKENNDYVLEAVAAYPDRLKGLACFDAMLTSAARETERCLEAGMSGVGELAFYLSGIDTRALEHLEPVMAVLREKGNPPCMIHTNEPIGHKYPGKTPVTLEQIYALCKAFPDNRLILAHWGGGVFFYNVMKKEVSSVLKNVWFDIAASPFLYTPAVYGMAVEAGLEDKVLFGTDFPLLDPNRYYRDMDQSKLTGEQKEKIYSKNAAALFL